MAFLRVSGKRTLSKLNAFDLVVTVALGSVLATVVLNSDVSLIEGLLAFVLLCALQYKIAWLSTRLRRFREIIKSEPSLLLRSGEYLRGRDAKRADYGRRNSCRRAVLRVLRSFAGRDLSSWRQIAASVLLLRPPSRRKRSTPSRRAPPKKALAEMISTTIQRRPTRIVAT